MKTKIRNEMIEGVSFFDSLSSYRTITRLCLGFIDFIPLKCLIAEGQA